MFHAVSPWINRLSLTIWAPRVYPPAFANKILSLKPELVSEGEGKPELESDVPSAEALFKRLHWSVWEDANLGPVMRYLRGNRHLHMPPTWEEASPSRWELFLMKYNV